MTQSQEEHLSLLPVIHGSLAVPQEGHLHHLRSSWGPQQIVQCDELDALGTFTSLERRQTNDCSICCFRCHLFLCVYLAFCLVKLPKASEPSRSLGNGGCEWKRCRVLLSLSTPGNSLSQAEPGRARPSKPDQGQSPAVIEDTVRTS
ncbi:hypothetical protein JOB18_030964 [Solea senegalensis]|uniref:Uncharacterized protein n=1 Tax=Solea senegalensis TaxID=28829 RepID=A0AAV6QQZ3_SOLSE|nr:hypothetical protein JOB18_030964 [Solea senegalensis]